jgi:hypothetical protein
MFRMYRIRKQNPHRLIPIHERRWNNRGLEVEGSVADPWHFGVDPDPWIHASGSGSRIRILLFSSLTFKMPTKTNFIFYFSAYYFLKVHLHNFSKIESQKESQNSRNQDFSNYFCMMKGDPDPEPDPYLWLMDPNPRGPKTCGSGSWFGSGSATLVEGGMNQSAGANS